MESLPQFGIFLVFTVPHGAARRLLGGRGKGPLQPYPVGSGNGRIVYFRGTYGRFAGTAGCRTAGLRFLQPIEAMMMVDFSGPDWMM